jgi:hypothetical protein
MTPSENAYHSEIQKCFHASDQSGTEADVIHVAERDSAMLMFLT